MWAIQLLAFAALFGWLSLIGLAVLRLLFGALQPAWYGIGRFFGLVVFFGLWWLIGYSQLLPLGVSTLLGSLIFGSIVALWYLTRFERRINWRLFLTHELVFLGLLLIFVTLRGFYPTVTDGEKPMEMVMLSSVMRSDSLPPMDAWLAEASINYYYFGYFVFGSIARMLGASSFIAAGYGLGAIWALSVIGVGYLGYTLTKRREAVVLLPLAYIVFSNLGGFVRLVTHWGEPLDWWAPSRQLPGTITEFPAFSYLFADFHPHMIATVWLLALIIAISLIAASQRITWAHGLLVGAILGEIFVTSTWSVVAAGIFVLISLVVFRVPLIATATGLTAAALIVVPYQNHLVGVFQGVTLVVNRSPINLWLLHWGLILVGLLGFLGWKQRPKLGWILLATGAVLVALVETVAVRDYIGGRYNTVFKLYWDAWLLLSLVAGCGLVWFWQRRLWGRALVTLTTVIGASYLVFAYPERLHHFSRWYGPDPASLAFAERPELLLPYQQLIRLDSGARLYESPGASYTGDSLLAAFSGVPSLLGWDGHEANWRGSWAEVDRRKDLASKIRRCRIPADVQAEFRFTHCYNGDGILEPVND